MMTTKLIVLAVILATVKAGVKPAAVNPAISPVASPAAVNGGDHYSFSYGVNDPSTGDVKDQHERRVGDSVIGKYSLLESDGTKRVVEYSADSRSGYNAVVRKEGVAVHPPSIGAARSLGNNAYAPHSGLFGNNLPFAGGSLNNLAYGGNPFAYASYQNPAYQAPVNRLNFGLNGNALAGGHLNPLAPGAHLNPLAPGAHLNSLAPGAHLNPLSPGNRPTLLSPNLYGAHPGLQHGLSGYNPLTFNPHASPLAHTQQNNAFQVSYSIQHPLTYGRHPNNYAGYNNLQYAGFANQLSYSGHSLGHPQGHTASGPTSYSNFNLNNYNRGTYAPYNQYAAPLPQGSGLPIAHNNGFHGSHGIRSNW
ncbi:hypothetical protein ACJJTC_012048 [Scirpophaga incertulas]